MKDKELKHIFRSNTILIYLALTLLTVAVGGNDISPTAIGGEVQAINDQLHIKKSVVGAFADEIKIVEPGENITYRIHFDNNDNNFTATDVIIVDYLPEELSFVSADYDFSLGYYDAATHTYTWEYADLESGDATNVKLTARVNDDVIPGTVITNSVAIDSSETSEAAANVDVIVSGSGTVNFLNLSKSVVGATEDIQKVGINEEVTYRIRFDSNDIAQPIADVSVIDFLPEDVSFVKADGDGIIGYYNDNMHTYTWLYPYICPDEVTYLDITVKVNPETVQGKNITNLVTIYSKEAALATSSVDIISKEGRLQVDYIEIIPDTIKRDGTSSNITVFIEMPEGIGIDDIKNEPLVLSPGNIQAGQPIIKEINGKTDITAVFDKNELLDALSGYGQFEVEITGKLKSGQTFYGQATITITGYEDISDFISNVIIEQIWDYGDPTDKTDLMYEFYFAVEAYSNTAINMDSDIASIEILTPAGNSFQIPKQSGQWSDGIWKSYEYDTELGIATWDYRARFENVTGLQDYGDGIYIITIHFVDSGCDQIAVWFGIPGTQNSIPQPIQEPVLISPSHNQTVVSPVEFTGQSCIDVNTTEIRIEIQEDRAGVYEKSLDVEETSFGPVNLTDGFWEIVLAFGQSASSDDNGISVEVGKYSQSTYNFTVIGNPLNSYEVWGGDTFIGLDNGIYIGGGYGNVDSLVLNGYVKLGESDGYTATFSGKYKYYFIGTRGMVLLDCIQGSDGSYYMSFEPNVEWSNISEPNNLLGPPDGKYAKIGAYDSHDDYNGYIVFTNPGNWTELNVITINITDDVEVESMEIIPDTIRREGTLTDIIVVLELPENIGRDDIGEEPLVFEFDQGSYSIESHDQLTTESDGKIKVVAVFDKTTVMNSVEGYGSFDLKVTGTLKSGYNFYGEGAITITRFAGN